MYALGAGVYRRSKINLVLMSCGFSLQTIFLYLRGQEVGRCPITNQFEVLVFLSWSLVLMYLIVGPTYRLTLLGAFTSPLVVVLQTFALLAPIDQRSVLRAEINPWMEFHAAISLIAYGAFALAGVAGVMYMVQERQLKTHHLHSIFYHLPSMSDLGKVTLRLIGLGFLLLTVGLGTGFAAGEVRNWAKVGSMIGVWLVYGAILLACRLRMLPPRRTALLSVMAFLLTLGTLWAINFISAPVET